MLRESGLNFTTADAMDEAAAKVVALRAASFGASTIGVESCPF